MSFFQNFRHLQSHQTPSEDLAEWKICSWGVRYRTQYVITWRHPEILTKKGRLKQNVAIVDFYLPDYKLVLEIDGKSHDTKAAKEKDRRRDEALTEAGYKVIRVRNEAVSGTLWTLPILEILGPYPNAGKRPV